MIYSMTGYANRTTQIKNLTFEIDIRSVNQKFCDLTIKCPEDIRKIEKSLREVIVSKIPRGKIDLRIHYKHDQYNNAKLNTNLLTHYLTIANQIKQFIPTATLNNISDLINLPNMLIIETPDENLIETNLLTEVSILLDELLNSQQSEGAKLFTIMQEKIERIAQIIEEAKALMPQVKQNYHDKLKQKLYEILDESASNEQRFHQEFAYFCQKIDVDEELSRLSGHCTRFKELLHSGGMIGKKIDFLSQEMHREANTFGAKSNSLNTSDLAIELKVLIDQIREQVQNIM